MTPRISQGLVVVVWTGQSAELVKMLRADPTHVSISRGAGEAETVEFESFRIGEKDLQRLALAFPEATLYKVAKGRASREKLAPPKFITALLKCPNPKCVTAQLREPVKAGFLVVKTKPLTLQCNYCERYVESSSARAQLLGT